ncbi:PD-(D/E)XK nuclease family protein [Anoxybacillus gonensis]|uniref:PD-(D/E)XK nuclease family protein n=1 Tax=Anoxybacillus gonensis TaxID=198467 RepID=UPI0002BD6358|nr:PD-(D/E)XK nuclease family protein [Anoxybacillus gonensis]EMI09195.1 hypothetical protein F510_2749 [Anoxybacillus gonensis]
MMNRYISYLKESPMFQLSLSSKELFHSNFIAWVISNYKNACSFLLTKHLNIESDFLITHVKREENHKDITVYFSNNEGESRKLFIENKVKGIPTYEQLLNYTTTDERVHYLLLSLIKPAFAQENKVYINELDKEWKCINYYDLAQILKELVGEVQEKNSYHANIIKDYIDLAISLHNLTEEINGDIRKEAYNYGTNSNILDQFREVRLHDFFLKLKHEMIAVEFYKEIKQRIPGIKLVPYKKWEKANVGEVFVGSGFTNGSGISEVKYVIGERFGSPIILGVQIQDTQFRLFTESSKRISIKIAEQLFRNNLWFNFSEAVKSEITEKEEYPKPGIKGKKFNTYSQPFFYRSVKLRECPIDSIVKIVTLYIDYIHREKQNLLKTIDEALY